MGRPFVIIMVVMAFFSALTTRAPMKSSSDNFNQFAASSSSSDYPSGSSEARSHDPVTSGDSNAVTLDRSSDGHFYADVEINGTPVHMLVDTGASGVALSREAARSAGIATSIGMNDVIGEGADGAIHGEQVRIDRIRLGSATAEGVGAVVLNAGEMSLLGQDFLQRFASVEIKNDQMVLR